jgi:hypothetical protein
MGQESQCKGGKIISALYGFRGSSVGSLGSCISRHCGWEYVVEQSYSSHGSQETEKEKEEEEEKKGRSQEQNTPFPGIPPVAYFLQLSPSTSQ